MAGSSPEHRYLRWAVGSGLALLLGCGGLASCLIFGNESYPAPVPGVTSGTPSPSSSVSVELSPSPEVTSAYFKTCTDAVKAGVPLPIRSNEPGYRVALDGDEDGKACE
jgi:hypothetical protein